MRIINSLRSFVNWARLFSWFGKGYFQYLFTKKNDALEAWLLRHLFCATNGRLNDAVAFFHRATRPPYHIRATDSFIQGLDSGRLPQIVQALDRDGYYVFEERLPEPLCQGLMDFALGAKFQVVDQSEKIQSEPVRFDPVQPAGVRFNAASQDIVENPAAQRLISDLGLLAIAQAYFRTKAVQDLVAMWWSVPSARPSSTGAQLFHFDMDRIKFVKFFFYLTDVDDNNGPHCYIAGSHRRLPAKLRQDRRYSDDEVFAHYPSDKRTVIKGPRGTICAVDTRGLHKGQQLVRGHRLMFQVEFAINLFGTYYPPIELNEKFSPAFLKKVRQYPYSFANFRRGAANGAGTGYQNGAVMPAAGAATGRARA